MNTFSRTCVSVVAILSTMLPMGAAAAQTGSIVSVGPCHTPTTCAPPPPNSGFTAVASGNYHVLGLQEDGSVVAWGLCDVEQCVLPPNNTGFVEIDAGDSHSLVSEDVGAVELKE
jgi:alpha-tubulin suppressor-like RCC1 family protein